MRNPISAALDTLTARFELRTAELRAGVTLIEAAAVDRFETDLLAVTGPLGRDDVRALAIEAAKMGLRTTDLVPMAQVYHRAQAVDLDADGILAAGRRPEQLRRIVAAVLEAYTPEGVITWWSGWLTADEHRRDRMEAGVLAEWSGVFPDARATGA
ncbi:MAG: hypothetical protein ABIQ01_05790 [Pseudolysinimonas sp.]